MSDLEESEIEESDVEEFKLTDEDYYAIEIAESVAQLLLKDPRITPEQATGLKNALYALERMPKVTPGSWTEFGIVYRAGTEEFSEMRYIDFRISASVFEISRGGSVYNSEVGSDSFSESGWAIGVGGDRETEGELYNIEDSVSEYLNLGAEITVDDQSEIHYE